MYPLWLHLLWVLAMNKLSAAKIGFAKNQIKQLQFEITRINQVIEEWKQTVLDHGGDLHDN